MTILDFGLGEAITGILSWLLPLLALIVVLIFFITRFLPNIIPQAKIVHYSCIPVFSIIVFFMGVNWNEAHWLAQLKLEQEKYEQAKQEQAKLNEQLIEKRKEITDALERGNANLRAANASFIKELQKKDASVAGLLSTLDQVTREKYMALDQVQKAEYEKQLQSVIDFEKKCPIIPELYINKMNDRARNKSDKDAKK